MNEQRNKTVGIMALIVSLIVVIPLGFVFNFLPALLLMTFFGSIGAVASWALLQGWGGYKIHLLIWTVGLFLAAHINSRKLEKKLDTILEDDKKENNDI